MIDLSHLLFRGCVVVLFFMLMLARLTAGVLTNAHLIPSTYTLRLVRTASNCSICQGRPPRSNGSCVNSLSRRQDVLFIFSFFFSLCSLKRHYLLSASGIA
ncbi:hypothetical protein F5X99DRAFT_10213 [Biscogniauxia marginata]|nr:hypothetical protein F5X99DRAFT_10213 [Biscogniauxia marginata]